MSRKFIGMQNVGELRLTIRNEIPVPAHNKTLGNQTNCAFVWHANQTS